MLLIELFNLIRLIFIKKHKLFLRYITHLFLIIIIIVWSNFIRPDAFSIIITALFIILILIWPGVNKFLQNKTVEVCFKLIFFFVFFNVANQFLVLYSNLEYFFFQTIIYLIFNLFLNMLNNLHRPLNFKDFILI